MYTYIGIQHIHLHWHTTHTPTPGVQYNIIHVPTPSVQHNTYTCTKRTTKHIYLHPVYNTIHIHIQSTTQRICMSQYHEYTMHIHSTACLQHNMYDMNTIPHVYQYHMHNMYIVPLVHDTTYTTYVPHRMYMTPHVHNATCMKCTRHRLHIAPPVQHVHNTTCTIMHTTAYVHSTTYTTCT